jgi:hypothetical protein
MRSVRATTIRAANLAYQLGGDARLLRQLADGADVLVLVECRDHNNEPIDVAAILGAGWRVWQNLRDGAHAGTVIAVCRGSGVHRRRLAAGRARVRRLASRLLRLSGPGHDVQSRYLREAHLADAHGPFTLAGAHIPLPGTGRQDDALAMLTDWWSTTPGRRAAFGDGNTSWRNVRRELDAPHGDGADVMFACWSAGWPDDTTVKATSLDPRKTDHHVLTFTTKETR